MSTVDAGFIPLVDAAALIVAREMGFATEEGIDLALHRAPSWSSIRDGLATGRLAVAHMLAPVPVAMAMGLGGLSVPLEAPMVLSVNGTVVGVTPRLAARLRDRGALGDFMDARTVGEALIAVAEPPLKVGVPFPFSMHAELLYYWLGSLGMRAPQEMQVRTVPPPLMADAMAAGEIDAFCVGEPWGSMAVERGIGEIVLPGCAIWRFAPEKVLAVRRASGGDEAAILRRLMVALWRAGHWLADPGHQMTAAEILSRAEYLNLPAEVIERSFAGRLVVNGSGQEQSAPRFIAFHAAAAQFPWRSQAAWIAGNIAARIGLDRAEAAGAARACFRPDVFRATLGPVGADLPGASEKLEGALDRPTPVASSRGRLFLGADRFFDGRIFDPSLG